MGTPVCSMTSWIGMRIGGKDRRCSNQGAKGARWRAQSPPKNPRSVGVLTLVPPEFGGGKVWQKEWRPFHPQYIAFLQLYFTVDGVWNHGTRLNGPDCTHY